METKTENYTFGFGDLPEFANANNRKLHAELLEQESILSHLLKKVESEKLRVKTLKEHKDNVLEEISLLRNIAESSRKQANTEKSLLKLAQVDLKKTKDLKKKTIIEKNELLEKEIIVKSEIFEVQKEIELLKKDVKLDEKELEDWILARTQKQQDEKTIEGFLKEDSSKVQNLRFEIDKLEKEQSELDTEYVNVAADVKLQQKYMGKILESIKTSRSEQKDILSKIQVIMNKITKTDTDVAELTDEYALLEDKRQQKIQQTKQLEQNVIRIESEVKQAERNLVLIKKEVEVKKHLVLTTKADLDKIKEELSLLKTENKALSIEVSSKEKELEGLSREFDSAKEANIKKEEELIRLKKKLDEQLSNTGDSTERAKKAEEFIIHQEERSNKLNRELVELSKRLYLEDQKHIKAVAEEKRLTLKLNLLNSRKRNMIDRLLGLDKEILRVNQILYETDFKLTTIRNKLNFINGERSEEEKIALNKEIEELTNKLADEKEKQKFLKKERTTLKTETRIAEAQLESTSKSVEKLNIALQEKQMAVEKLQSIRQTNKQSLRAAQEKLADMKVESTKLKTDLASKLAESKVLRDTELSLQHKINETRIELSRVEKELKMEFKLVTEDLNELIKEKNSKKIEIEKLTKRYEVIKKDFPIESDDSDAENKAERSQSYYIIKNAQRRAELEQKNHNSLEEIAKLEKDLEFLNNASNQLTQKNVDFRKSLKKVGKSSKEAMKLVKLQKEAEDVRSKYVELKREVESTQKDIDEAEMFIKNCNFKVSEYVEEKVLLEQENVILEKDIKELKEEYAVVKNDINNIDKNMLKSDDVKLKALWYNIKTERATKLYETVHSLLLDMFKKHPKLQQSLSEKIE